MRQKEDIRPAAQETVGIRQTEDERQAIYMRLIGNMRQRRTIGIYRQGTRDRQETETDSSH